MLCDNTPTFPIPAIAGGPAQPLLIVENLTKHFPVRGGLLNRQVATVQAVDDISFSVRKGETLGIVGESGCGKSTTARLLMRLMEPDAGSVVFDGDQVGDKRGISISDMRRQIQMVFQDSYTSLNPRMTMAESIAYAPRMHGLARKDAYDRAESLLSRVGLNPRQYARRYPHEPVRGAAPARQHRPRFGLGTQAGDPGRSRCRAGQIGLRHRCSTCSAT